MRLHARPAEGFGGEIDVGAHPGLGKQLGHGGSQLPSEVPCLPLDLPGEEGEALERRLIEAGGEAELAAVAEENSLDRSMR